MLKLNCVCNLLTVGNSCCVQLIASIGKTTTSDLHHTRLITNTTKLTCPYKIRYSNTTLVPIQLWPHFPGPFPGPCHSQCSKACPYCKQQKAGGDLGTGLMSFHVWCDFPPCAGFDHCVSSCSSLLLTCALFEGRVDAAETCDLARLEVRHQVMGAQSRRVRITSPHLQILAPLSHPHKLPISSSLLIATAHTVHEIPHCSHCS